MAAFFTAGTYDPKVPALLTEAFTRAIVEAYGRTKPVLCLGPVRTKKLSLRRS